MPNLLKNDGWQAFLIPPKTGELARIIGEWLKNQDYGSEPNIDDSCEKGWSVYNTQQWDATFAVQPTWIEYHK